MIPSFLLSLREGFEAALVLGIAFGALYKINRRDLAPAVWGGAGAAAGLSLLVAGLLFSLGAGIEGRSEEIFEGVALLFAAVLLTWMIFWTRRQAKSLAKEIESNVLHEVASGGKRALFLLAFIAILREGLELALYLVVSAFNADGFQIILGTAGGLITAASLGLILFFTTRGLSVKRFFFITNILLILFAAGLVAHSIHEFNEAGIVPSIVEHVWDMNRFLSEDSAVGLVLQTLLGYHANPSLMEVIGYAGYFLFLGVLFRKSASPARRSVRVKESIETSSK